jgi:hypothetical protein
VKARSAAKPVSTGVFHRHDRKQVWCQECGKLEPVEPKAPKSRWPAKKTEDAPVKRQGRCEHRLRPGTFCKDCGVIKP